MTVKEKITFIEEIVLLWEARSNRDLGDIGVLSQLDLGCLKIEVRAFILDYLVEKELLN